MISIIEYLLGNKNKHANSNLEPKYVFDKLCNGKKYRVAAQVVKELENFIKDDKWIKYIDYILEILLEAYENENYEMNIYPTLETFYVTPEQKTITYNEKSKTIKGSAVAGTVVFHLIDATRCTLLSIEIWNKFVEIYSCIGEDFKDFMGRIAQGNFKWDLEFNSDTFDDENEALNYFKSVIKKKLGL